MRRHVPGWRGLAGAAAVALGLAALWPALARAGAEDYAGQLGDAAPQLTAHGDLAPDIMITVSVMNASGKLAKKVTSENRLMLDSYITVQRSRGRKVAFDLVCTATYVNARGEVPGLREEAGDCFYGGVDADGIGVRLNFPVSFRPQKSDPEGTEGFVIHVTDRLTGAETEFLVSYDWQGGQE